MLKQLTWQYVILRPSLASQQVGQRALVRNLFKTYARAMDDSDDRVQLHLLPRWAQEELPRAVKRDSNTKAARARLAADIICSMSEQQAVDVHERLLGTAFGSVTDLL